MNPTLGTKGLAYMYNNSMVNVQNATKRGQTMANYVMGADFYTFGPRHVWSPGKLWLNK